MFYNQRWLAYAIFSNYFQITQNIHRYITSSKHTCLKKFGYTKHPSIIVLYRYSSTDINKIKFWFLCGSELNTPHTTAAASTSHLL